MHQVGISQLKSGHRSLSAKSLRLLHLLQSATALATGMAMAAAAIPSAVPEDWPYRLQQQELVLLKMQRELAVLERRWQQYHAMEQLLQYLRLNENLDTRQKRWLADQSHQQQLKEAGCNATTRWMLQQEVLALEAWLAAWRRRGAGAFME